MSFSSEFKAFAMRGNVVDLAVGVIIGAAFGKIVASLVGDIAMPLIGTLLGGLDFTDLAVQVGEAKILYGKFIQTCVDFMIIALAIFVAAAITESTSGGKEDSSTVRCSVGATVSIGDPTHAHSASSSNTGGGGAHENMPPYLLTTKIIRV